MTRYHYLHYLHLESCPHRCVPPPGLFQVVGEFGDIVTVCLITSVKKHTHLRPERSCY